MNRLRLRFVITDMSTGEILLNKLIPDVGFGVVHGYTAEKEIKKYASCFSRGAAMGKALQFQIQTVSDFALQQNIVF